MQDIQLFRSLVLSHNGTPVTTSNKIANVFGKQHKSVLRAIENLDCSSEFRRLNFELCCRIKALPCAAHYLELYPTKTKMGFCCTASAVAW